MAQPWGLIIMLLMRKCQRPVMDYIGSHSAFQVETEPGQVVVEKFLETW